MPSEPAPPKADVANPATTKTEGASASASNSGSTLSTQGLHNLDAPALPPPALPPPALPPPAAAAPPPPPPGGGGGDGETKKTTLVKHPGLTDVQEAPSIGGPTPTKTAPPPPPPAAAAAAAAPPPPPLPPPSAHGVPLPGMQRTPIDQARLGGDQYDGKMAAKKHTNEMAAMAARELEMKEARAAASAAAAASGGGDARSIPCNPKTPAAPPQHVLEARKMAAREKVEATAKAMVATTSAM